MRARLGNVLYAWQVLEDGDWGVIAAVVDGKPTPLVSRSLTVVSTFRQYAEQHGKTTGLTVRLARFELDVVVERLVAS